jgi:hypothetical protein
MNMIEGLHYDVPSEKIRELLGKRAAQCDQKFALYKEQGEAQKALAVKLTGLEPDMPKHSGDQSDNLLSKAMEYQERAKMYRFLIEHLIKDVYRLSHEDLRFLGVIDRY